jgi:nitrogen fixation/metabolism regulation signal transduction histidine kinase
MIRETMEGVDRVKRIVTDLKGFSRMVDYELKRADINQCLKAP